MPDDTLTPAASPALAARSRHYPQHWEGRVPLRVRMMTSVVPDFIFRLTEPRYRDCVAAEGREYDAWVNSHGAVSALVGGVPLGLKPGEFEVTAWHGES